MTATESAFRPKLDEQTGVGANPAEVQAKVPFALSSSAYIPKERYFDQGFLELEKAHIWPHTWQMAARLEEIPDPGDYVEYENAGNSILIVHQQDGSVKALHNACRHRATQLAKGAGRFPGGQIVCPFHGWRWSLDGSSSGVTMPELFDPACLSPAELRLRECKVQVWAGMVWINLDPDAAPLAEALGEVMRVLDGVGVGNMRVHWWRQVILKANWKLNMEAFLENYHVPQTHPQLTVGPPRPSSMTTKYTVYPGGHGSFQPEGGRVSSWNGDDFIEMSELLQQGMDAMISERDVQVFQGIRNKVGVDNPNFISEAVKALYDYAAGAGIAMPAQSEYTKLWGGMMFAFPNYFMLPQYENCLAYRMRPYNDDPECSLLDVWSLTTYPEGQEPGRAVLEGIFEQDDEQHWGLVPRQDFSNIERQQRGMHSTSFEKMRLSGVVERIITNYQEEIDRMIARGKSAV